MPVAIPLAVMAAAMTVQTVHGIKEANRAREDMEKKDAEAKAQQDKLMKEQKAAKDQEGFETESTLNRSAQIQRQKSLAAQAQGRGGTILTGDSVGGGASGNQDEDYGTTILGG